MRRSLGVAIATYNRAALTRAVFANVHDDSRVTRVAISDDCSDVAEWHGLLDTASRMSKVRVARNSQNLGSWTNKREAVVLCDASWVALIDSDNVIGLEYLDALWAMHNWDEDILYLPMSGGPMLNYERFRGITICRDSLPSSNWLGDPLFQMALNTGNFFMSRAAHLAVSGGPAEESYASDGIYFVYRWLASGRRAIVTPGLSYTHLVHEGHWMKTAMQSLTFSNELIRRMQANSWEVPCVA
jgi:glycosyltransferase involved in cell wall biosynthesis